MIISMLREGLGNISSASMALAVHLVLAQLYRGLSDMIPEKEQRNREIFERYMVGERAVDLARAFGISVRRVTRLIGRFLNCGQQ